ncbi:signal peptidase I [Curtobacterium ammoniigenes]|uniref:signal peptidase I n=1 Tax=Curtobacterium ammoniigenes TaxID=395387 RepID=UPI00082E5157|nr:signal peptidase I [Curtobacterium ammoniigenes]
MMIDLLITLWRVTGAALLVALVAPLAWQVASGDSYMTVTGSSMVPTYLVGDVLLIRSPDGSELTRKGQIVVVTKSAGDRTQQYVHRVHQPTPDGAVLKGDNNTAPDPIEVTSSLVLGAPRIALTGTSADIFRFLQSWGGRIITAAIAVPAFIVPARRRPRAARPGEPRPS